MEVSKSEFARLINVSPGRVSQYITEGKIHGPALVGEGRSARIAVDVARQQLRRSLDSAQMVGNGVTTRLDAAPRSQAVEAPPEDELPLTSGDLVAEQIKLERLKELRNRNRRAEEEDLERRGLYMRTEDGRRGMQATAARVLNIVEGGLAGMAADIAAKFGVPQRDVLHLLRLGMRKVRDSAAKEAGEAARSMPATIEDEPD